MELYIVTGCTSGLGLALHQKLVTVESGIKCLFLGRNLSRVSKSPRHTYIECDFSTGLVPNIINELDRMKYSNVILISNAGTIEPIGKVKDIDAESLQKSVSINFISPALLVMSLLSWAKSNIISLQIVNISSGAALRPIQGWAGYCATKASIRMFLDVLELESNNRGVEIIHIDPGVMDTAMQKSIRQSSSLAMPDVDDFRGFKLNKKLKSVSDVAESLLETLRVVK